MALGRPGGDARRIGRPPGRSRRGGCGFLIHLVADATHPDADGLRPVIGRIGGHRLERFVGPPGPAPADPEAIRGDGGCWVRLRFV